MHGRDIAYKVCLNFARKEPFAKAKAMVINMNKLPKKTAGLEERLGHKFKDTELIRTALTHSSYSHEQRIKHNFCRCNERLEFLGDSVLSIIASEYLFESFRDRDEGDLTKLRAEIVCERALAGYAVEIGLGDYLLLGIGEEKNGGRKSKSILSDAFEAVLAAVYLDSGENGKAEVSKFLMPFLEAEVGKTEKAGRGHDFKTQLQQFIQQDSSAELEYVIVNETGPDHCKTFEAEARMGSNIIGRGEGKTKREAEQMAAKEALELFGNI